VAIVPMADAVSNTTASSAEYNKLIDNIEDLDARLGAVTSGASANSRLISLEALTTNTSGAVGIGNQRLSDRLGAGITTSATADARFGSGVGTGSNVLTGSASSQLADIRSRLSVVEGGGSGVTFVERAGTNSTLTTAYTAIPFATSILSGSGLTVLSGTVANTRFQLSPGVWCISCSLRLNTGTGGLIGVMFVEGAAGDVATPEGQERTLAMDTAQAANGALAVSMSSIVVVPSAATKIVRVTGAVTNPPATASFYATDPHRPRISFQRLSS
jgi:hypothetical protein